MKSKTKRKNVNFDPSHVTNQCIKLKFVSGQKIEMFRRAPLHDNQLAATAIPVFGEKQMGQIEKKGMTRKRITYI